MDHVTNTFESLKPEAWTSRTAIILAHGAGQGMNSPFINNTFAFIRILSSCSPLNSTIGCQQSCSSLNRRLFTLIIKCQREVVESQLVLIVETNHSW